MAKFHKTKNKKKIKYQIVFWYCNIYLLSAVTWKWLSRCIPWNYYFWI